MLKVAKLPKTGDEKASFTAWTSSLVPVGLKGTSGPESPQAVRATHAAAIRVTERLVHCRTRIGRASVSWAWGRPYRRASVGKYLGGWTLGVRGGPATNPFRPAAGGGEGNGYAKVCTGSWELGAGSWELGAGSWELGAGSWGIAVDTRTHAGSEAEEHLADLLGGCVHRHPEVRGDVSQITRKQ